MSDEKNLGDDLNDMLGDAKDGAKKAAGEAKQSASEFSKGASEVLDAENKKLVAGVVAILIGSLGIHKFILGYTKEGIIQIVATFVTCGIAGIIPFIEGIIYLTKSDEEFYNTYQVGKKGWF
ncbi:TM2 domain-containing protein [Algibacter lectus]|uniref:TM2 domain-containing protein n=1 Tax=Algibacter lectus TaxID=221126 RepID=A0A090V7L0_9FLAO|nr:TM2 domain-containing protein [Algibacter lectus]MDO7137332.1 TM2 domain-containing protein [Algibacter lectus]TDY62192.1 TM2 domain-containing protein [Algibacter lectus]SFC74029.1 TM2 domain-containing protein [Algibacter lectus]GAL60801.1 Tsr1131 protein [Algibacter lectus]GAL78680.1 Tsr1131 protein [Algibacter lectus]